jgi:ribosomal protein S2
MRRKQEKEEMRKSQETKTRELRLKRRTESKFHRGGKKEERQPGMEAYVHSRREGTVRRDRNQSVEQLVLVLNRVEKRRKEGKQILLVGTTPELGRLRERVGSKPASGGNPGRLGYVTRGWVSGSLTNSGLVTRKAKGIPVKARGELPGLIVFRHPNDHGVGRKEARRCGIPTVGIADSDCKYLDRLTYPVPGNDESRAGQRRVTRRLQLLQTKG